MSGNDLNSKCLPGHFSGSICREGVAYAFRQNRFCAGHGTSAVEGFSSLRRSLPGSSQSPEFFLSRSVSCDGLRSTDLSGEFTGHRGLSSSPTDEALSHGDPKRRIPEHPRLRQRDTRLEDSRRLCSSLNLDRERSVRRRRFRCRTQGDRLRLGLHHHRLVPLRISLGSLPEDESGHQASYSFRPARLHSSIHQHYRWQGPRRQHPGRDSSGGRVLLCDGSWLSGFHPPVSDGAMPGLLRDPFQEQLRIPKALFSSDREDNWGPMRSDDRFDRLLFREGLSGQDATDSLLRFQDRKGSDLFDQQLRVAASDHRITLQMPLAGRTLFQMDQTAPSHQTFFRDVRERREDSSVDRRLDLRAGRDHEEAVEDRGEPLHNFADFERDRFRENAHFTSLGGRSLQSARRQHGQPVEFIRLTVGH